MSASLFEYKSNDLIEQVTDRKRAAGSQYRRPARVTQRSFTLGAFSDTYSTFVISSFDELVIAMFPGGANMTLPKKVDNIPTS